MIRIKPLILMKKFITYREGLLLYILANIYLIVTVPYSWLYYDVRYYIEWYNVAWSYGFFVSKTILSEITPSIIVVPKGLLYIYVYSSKASYPPLPILLFITTHSIGEALINNVQIVRLIDKLPLIISFNILYSLLKKHYGWKAGLLWLINGFSYLTVYSYHTDLLASLFLYLSYLEFIKKNNPWRTGLYLAIATLIKPILVLTGLLYLITYLKKHDLRKTCIYISSGLITGLTITAPFLIIDPYSFITKSFFFHMNRYPQEYSIWALPIYIVNYQIILIPNIVIWLWVPILLVSLLYIIYRFSKLEDIDEKTLLKYMLLLLLITILFNKVGNTNYFTWCLPLLISYAYIKELYRNTFFITTYVFVSILITIVAPFTTFYPAYVVQGSVYIIEDLAYYSATDIAQKSFDPYTIQNVMAEYFRINAYWFFNTLYMCINISYIVYTIIYNIYIIYLIHILVKGDRETHGARV